MEQRLPVFAQICQQLNHILQVALRFDRFGHIAAAAFQLVAAGSVLNDPALLLRLHQPVVDTQGYAAAVGKLGEDRLFLRGGRVFADRPHTAIAVAQDIMVGKEFDRAGQDHVEEVLGADFLRLLRRQYFRFSLEHFSSLPPFCKGRGRYIKNQPFCCLQND